MIPGLLVDVNTLALLCIDIISRGVEIFAVLLIFGSVVSGSLKFFFRKQNQVTGKSDRITEFRQYLGQWLLLGLELLVAADVIRTIALDQTLESVAGLGLLVIVRTFLSWALVVEMEGRWPWQQPDVKRQIEQDR